MNGSSAPARPARASVDNRSFVLTRVQPALSGLMDGSLSTLAPIFAVVLASFARSFIAVTVGGVIIAALSAGLGIAAAG
jgi:erythrin-vacuolar iron transport family protein